MTTADPKYKSLLMATLPALLQVLVLVLAFRT